MTHCFRLSLKFLKPTLWAKEYIFFDANTSRQRSEKMDLSKREQ